MRQFVCDRCKKVGGVPYATIQRLNRDGTIVDDDYRIMNEIEICEKCFIELFPKKG